MAQTDKKNTVYYVIVNKVSGHMLLEDGKLPFYWNATCAKERCALFNGFKVLKIQALDLNYLIHSEHVGQFKKQVARLKKIQKVAAKS